HGLVRNRQAVNDSDGDVVEGYRGAIGGPVGIHLQTVGSGWESDEPRAIPPYRVEGGFGKAMSVILRAHEDDPLASGRPARAIPEAQVDEAASVGIHDE